MQKFTGFARKNAGGVMSAGTGTWVAYLAGTTTPVPVYITDDTGNPVVNFTIPTTGKIEFYARNGDIKVVATEGAETVTVDDETMMAGLLYGTLAARPAAGSVDRLYVATDIGRLYYDNGSAWKELPDFALDAMDWNPAADVVAAATTDVFGGTGNYVEVTHASGTVAITALANANAIEGSPRLVKLTITGGTLTLTHNATSCEIADGESLTLATGMLLLVTGKGGSNVRVQPLRGKATQAEVRAGTEDNKFVTPKGVRDAVLLDSGTVSAVASKDISLAYAGYRHFELEVDGVRPATDEAFLWLRTSTDGGVSFAAGASDYNWANFIVESGTGSTAASNDAADSEIQVGDAGMDSGASTSHMSAIFNIFAPDGTTRHKTIEYRAVWNANGVWRCANGFGVRLATADVDALQLLASTGNISLTYRLYGKP